MKRRVAWRCWRPTRAGRPVSMRSTILRPPTSCVCPCRRRCAACGFPAEPWRPAAGEQQQPHIRRDRRRCPPSHSRGMTIRTPVRPRPPPAEQGSVSRRARSWRRLVVVGRSIVVVRRFGRVVAGATRGRSGGRGGGVVGATTSASTWRRLRANAAETPAASSAEVTCRGQEAGKVGLHGREAHRLDVVTLDGRDRVVQPGGTPIVLPVHNARAPCARLVGVNWWLAVTDRVVAGRCRRRRRSR